MGCPNWKNDLSNKSGIIMVAHAGCGTWTKHLPFVLDGTANMASTWTRCFVDHSDVVQEARFCCPDSQTWDSLPLSPLFSATTNADRVGDNQILLLSACCGRLTTILSVGHSFLLMCLLIILYMEIVTIDLELNWLFTVP